MIGKTTSARAGTDLGRHERLFRLRRCASGLAQAELLGNGPGGKQPAPTPPPEGNGRPGRPPAGRPRSAKGREPRRSCAPRCARPPARRTGRRREPRPEAAHPVTSSRRGPLRRRARGAAARAPRAAARNRPRSRPRRVRTFAAGEREVRDVDSRLAQDRADACRRRPGRPGSSRRRRSLRAELERQAVHLDDAGVAAPRRASRRRCAGNPPPDERDADRAGVVAGLLVARLVRPSSPGPAPRRAR